MPEGYADELADSLFERDFDHDDRRYCLECAHLQRSGGCFAASQGLIKGIDSKNYAPVRNVLQRCPAFEWQKPA